MKRVTLTFQQQINYINLKYKYRALRSNDGNSTCISSTHTWTKYNNNLDINQYATTNWYDEIILIYYYYVGLQKVVQKRGGKAQKWLETRINMQ